MNFSPCFLLFFRREMGHFSNFSVENSKPRKCATLVLPSIIIMEMIRLIVMYLYNRFTVNWGGQICKDFNTIKSLHFHKCSDLYLWCSFLCISKSNFVRVCTKFCKMCQSFSDFPNLWHECRYSQKFQILRHFSKFSKHETATQSKFILNDFQWNCRFRSKIHT